MPNETHEELRIYADMEGTEVGEYLGSLALMRRFTTDDGVSPEFSAALDKEIANQLEWIKGATRIVEETYTPPPVTTKELEWLE